MDIRKLQKLAVDALEDIKAKDIEVINTTKLTSLFDRIIVASGDSNRQVKALARNVHNTVKEAGGSIVGIEGEDAGEWVLVDLGDIVVHIMQPAVRAHYNLEELWQTQPKRATERAPAPARARAPAKAPARAKPTTSSRSSTSPSTKNGNLPPSASEVKPRRTKAPAKRAPAKAKVA
jgi:ribosome-associated protein